MINAKDKEGKWLLLKMEQKDVFCVKFIIKHSINRLSNVNAKTSIFYRKINVFQLRNFVVLAQYLWVELASNSLKQNQFVYKRKIKFMMKLMGNAYALRKQNSRQVYQVNKLVFPNVQMEHLQMWIHYLASAQLDCT